MNRPELGQRIRATATAYRIATSKDGREWKSHPCEPFEGVYMGSRFKQNGYYVPAGTDFDWEGDPVSDHGPYFDCRSTSEVWLIVTNLYHDPKLVFPADCEIIERENPNE
jgi:hypothetical protein